MLKLLELPVSVVVDLEAEVAASYPSVVVEPAPVDRKLIPHVYSAPIAIFGAMKYSAPMKPRTPKPKVLPTLLAVVREPPLTFLVPKSVEVGDVLVLVIAFP